MSKLEVMEAIKQLWFRKQNNTVLLLIMKGDKLNEKERVHIARKRRQIKPRRRALLTSAHGQDEERRQRLKEKAQQSK